MGWILRNKTQRNRGFSRAGLAVCLAVLAGALSLPAGAFAEVVETPAQITPTAGVTAATLNHAFLGQAGYSITLTAKATAGGTTCQTGGTWSVSSGTLPTGLSLAATSAGAPTATISGTPTATAGVRNWGPFTVTWTKPGSSSPCDTNATGTWTLPVVHKFSGAPLPASGNLSGITRSSTAVFLAASNTNQVFTIAGANVINPTGLSVTDFSSNFPASSLNWPNGIAAIGAEVYTTNFFATTTKNVSSTLGGSGTNTDLPLCSNAAGVGTAQNGTDIFVTCPGSNKIYQLNTSGAVVGTPLTLPTCTNVCRPAAILLIPRTDGHTRDVLVADAGNDRVFWIRPTTTGPEVGSLNGTTEDTVSGNPVALDAGCVPANMTTDTPTSSGSTHIAYVACPGLGKVDRINVDTSNSSPALSVNTSFLVGNSVNSRPFDVKLDDDLSTPNLIVANSGTSASSVDADRDVRAMTITGTNQVTVQLGSTSIPDGIALFPALGSPARSIAYITDEGTGSVWVVDPPDVKKAKNQGRDVARSASKRRASARALRRNIAELRAHAAFDPLNP